MRCIHRVAIITPGLSTARLGRQLQLSAYWVWQHKHWPSAAIVPVHAIMETQTCAQTPARLSVPHSSSSLRPPLCVRLTTELLSVAESPLLVFTVLSLCQNRPNASAACGAGPLCAYACVVCAYVVLCLCVCVQPSVPALAHG